MQCAEVVVEPELIPDRMTRYSPSAVNAEGMLPPIQWLKPTGEQTTNKVLAIILLEHEGAIPVLGVNTREQMMLIRPQATVLHGPLLEIGIIPEEDPQPILDGVIHEGLSPIRVK
jgi:hypothetical protein